MVPILTPLESIISVELRGREWNWETEAGLNHHGTGRELYLYFGGLDPLLGGAYCGCLGSSARLELFFELDMVMCYSLL